MRDRNEEEPSANSRLALPYWEGVGLGDAKPSVSAARAILLPVPHSSNASRVECSGTRCAGESVHEYNKELP